MATKRKQTVVEEIQDTKAEVRAERPKRTYTKRTPPPTEIVDEEMREFARAPVSLGVKHKDRVESGKMNLTEVARALHKHREIIVRMVAAGRLERDEDGLFDADEVQEMAEELAIQRADPAIDYLKRGYELELNHKEMSHTILFAQYSKMFALLERTLDRLASQNERLAERNYSLTEERRERIADDTNAKIEVLAAERDAKNQEEFLGLAKEAFGKFTGASKGGEFLSTAKEIFEDIGEEGLAALMPHLKPSTMGKMQKLMAAAEGAE